MNQTHETTRLGCKYADQYYAGEFNITEEEAKDIYICAVDSITGIPECPFGFLSDCLEEMHLPDNYKNGVVLDLLGNKVKTCKLIPVELSPTKGGYECSDCKGIIRGMVEFMKYCYRCGVRIE